ncbi:MAG: lysophospholipid acyltransferase family protein [Bacteroidetes bacterium]|nr:lysophospholipid acyltransferase family protein [Bacteroidota bacterium]
MYIPALGPNVPTWGNPVSKILGKWILQSMGWRFQGEIPNIRKFVAIGVPHTSNWDFVIGMAALMALGIRVHWLGKASIFKWPVNKIWRWLGGRPVDRFSAHGVVDQVAEQFTTHEKFLLGLSPEGTRKTVEKWRSGFYHIAHKADVPIFLVAFDFKFKALTFLGLVHPTGNQTEDLRKIIDAYRPIQGKYPKDLPEVPDGP